MTTDDKHCARDWLELHAALESAQAGERLKRKWLAMYPHMALFAPRCAGRTAARLYQNIGTKVHRYAADDAKFAAAFKAEWVCCDEAEPCACAETSTRNCPEPDRPGEE